MFYVMRNYWPAEYGDEDVREVRPLSVPGVNPGLGLPLPPDFPEVSYIVGKLAPLPPFFWANTHLLMSQTAVEALERSGETHFELWPVRVVDLHGKEDRISYQRVHLLDYVACLDREKSDFTLYDWDQSGQAIDHMRRLVLDESRIPPDRHLFRLKEFSPVDLVSERLVKCFEQAGIPRIVFQPVDEYDSKGLYWPEPM